MSTFVTADIVGGLGNQMFILAAQFAYAKRCGKVMVVNTSQLVSPSSTYRKTYWDTPLMQKILQHSVVIDLGKSEGVSKFNSYTNANASLQVFQEPSFCFTQIPDFTDCNVNLKGYFQCTQHFGNCSKEIRDFYRLDSNDQRFEKNKDTVSVHVRRGDYLLYSNVHVVQSIDYYRNAISQHFSSASRFLLFSDDVAWLKENQNNLNIPANAICEIFDNSDEIESLYEMQSCGAGHIIANSSFSWWAAFLGCSDFDTKIVVAPAIWFGPDGPKDTQDIYINNWIKI